MIFIALIDPIKANFSCQITLFAFAIMLGLAWILLQFLNIDQQVAGVVALENKDMVASPLLGLK